MKSATRENTNSERPLSASGRRRRREAIQTAHHLFTEKGFEQTSLQEIAEAAETTVPTLYNHFGSKQGLLLAVFDNFLHELTDILDTKGYPDIEDPAQFLVENQFQMLTVLIELLHPKLWNDSYTSFYQGTDSREAHRIQDFFISRVQSCLAAMKMRDMIKTDEDLDVIAEIIDHLTLATIQDNPSIRQGDFDPDALRAQLDRLLKPIVKLLTG